MTHPAAFLHREVAYVAYHFHWALDDILDLEHPDRRRYVAEIAHLNERINEGR